MKKVKIESINGAVGQYLFKRKYTETDTFRKSKVKAVQSIEQFMSSSNYAVLSNSNVITMQGLPFELKDAETQYEELVKWINSLEEAERSQLHALLFPLFLTIYRQLRNIGNSVGAKAFYTKFLRSFTFHIEMREIASKYCNDPNVAQFRFSVELPHDLLHTLLEHLAKCQHYILIQILNSSLQITASDLTVENLKDTPKLEKGIESSNDTEDFLHAMSALEKLPEPVPAMKLYTIDSSLRRLTSGIISSEGKLFACGVEDSSIMLGSFRASRTFPAKTFAASWDFASRVEQFRLNETETTDDGPRSANPTFLRGHSGPVYSVNFTKDSTSLLSGSEDSNLRLWSVDSSECRAVYRGHTYPVWCSAISSVSQYFASGSEDRTGKIWSFERTYPLRILAGHTGDVDCIEFHPNGLYIATGSSDRSVRMWSVTDGSLVRSLVGHRMTILSVAFSPCGKMIASAGEDRRIKIWDVAMSSLLHELRGHNDTVHGVTWISPTQLASYSADNTVRTWTIQKTDSTSAVSEQSDGLLATYTIPAPLKPIYVTRNANRNTLVTMASTD